ncbi:hypothetical protein [Agromyces ramosus]|uniref:Uncharacterized protein n=1 Tax=Agromyces ramosus TaxID=33879 RepID=A0ABU0R651_9MICO|nr:hypothetical protein [Agromyces ramosus]MDQ0893543.1 hypothetical protein [Agromyces ramosus]
MRSEPPTGDELTRLLVTMKGNVLAQVAQEATSAKRSTLTDRVIAIALGVALLLGIGAGAAFAFGIVPPLAAPPTATSAAAPTPTPTPKPTPTLTPTPTQAPLVTVVESGPPPSRYGLECETLVDESLVFDLFNAEVGPTDPLVTASGVGTTIPRHTSILSEGGTVCEWSNGAPYHDHYGWSPDYVGVTVSILPRPAEGWSERATAYGEPRNDTGCNDTVCSASAAVGDAWVTVEALGGESNAMNAASWQPLVDSIIGVMSASGPATELVVPERASSPFPLDCDVVIPLETVRSLTATPDADSRGHGGGGWSLWAEARILAENDGCMWGPAQSDSVVASLSGIQNGAWAYERILHAGTTAPVELAGLGPNDSATLRCAAEYSSCAVDLRVGQDWFNIAANDEATAIALAEAALAQLGR